MALAITGVNAYTHKFILDKTYDVVFKHSPVLLRMKTKHRYAFRGGRTIDVPIMHRKLQGGSTTRGATVDTAWINTETAFSIVPKVYYVNLTLYAYDGLLNMGPAAVMSQIALKLANAAATMGENLAVDLYLSGLANANVITNLGQDSDTTSLDAFAQWIDNGVNVLTVGGVTRTDLAAAGVISGGNAYFRSIGGAIATTDLNNAVAKAWFGPDRPDLICTDPITWMFVHNKLAANQRYLREDTDVAKAGFMNIQYLGADMVADNYCPTGSIWGLNSKYCQFYISENPLYQFGFTGFKTDQATLGDVAGQYVFGGNFAYPNPRSAFQLCQVTS